MLKYQGQAKEINNYYNIKKYNDDYYKLVYFKYPVKNYQEEGKIIKRDVNDIKLESNISRSRTNVFEYAICNDFEYFITLTLDKKKYNRYDLDNYIKDLGQFIRDARKKHNTDIQYLLIPEPHKDGAWHMHGLIRGLPVEDLKQFKSSDRLPKNMNKMINDGRLLYNWISYSKKFGFVSVERIKNTIYVSKYITKYITKDMDLIQLERKNKKSYYCSRGLKKAEIIKEGSMSGNIETRLKKLNSYQNDYLITYDLNLDDLIDLFT
jgi:hypothetical protein